MRWSASSDTAVSAGVLSSSALRDFLLGGALLRLEAAAGLGVAAGLGAARFLGVFPAVDPDVRNFEEFRRRGGSGVAGLFGLVLAAPLSFGGASSAVAAFSGDELRPLTGTFTVVVLPVLTAEFERRPLFARGFGGGGSTTESWAPSSLSSSPSLPPGNPRVKFGGPPRFFPLPLGVPSCPPSSRSACTTTLMRHGESTELDVAVILVGEWMLTLEVLWGLGGEDMKRSLEGDRERRRGGSAMEGPLGPESGSGEDDSQRNGIAAAAMAIPHCVRQEQRKKKKKQWVDI